MVSLRAAVLSRRRFDDKDGWLKMVGSSLNMVGNYFARLVDETTLPGGEQWPIMKLNIRRLVIIQTR